LYYLLILPPPPPYVCCFSHWLLCQVLRVAFLSTCFFYRATVSFLHFVFILSDFSELEKDEWEPWCQENFQRGLSLQRRA
jgi:hypothetical protein